MRHSLRGFGLVELAFAVYGLGPSWTGHRSVVGLSDDGARHTSAVELLHGDPHDPGGTAVIVETMQETGQRWSVEVLAEIMLETGLDILLPAPDPKLPDPRRQLIEPKETRAYEAELAVRLRRAARRSVPIRVDNRLVDFLAWRATDHGAQGPPLATLMCRSSAAGSSPPRSSSRP